MPVAAGNGPLVGPTPQSPGSSPPSSPSSPSSPSTPSNPYDTPIPDPSSYAGAAALANNAYNNALAQINQNRLSTLTNYGYTGTIDPTTGQVTGVQVDPSAVYGQLQTLLHNEGVADQQAANAQHDRGVYGGLAHQAVTASHYDYGAQKTQLGEDLVNALADLSGQQQSAAETRDSAIGDAEQTALQNEIASESAMNPTDWLSYMLGQVNEPAKAPASTAPAPKPAKAPVAKARAVHTHLSKPHKRGLIN